MGEGDQAVEHPRGVAPTGDAQRDLFGSAPRLPEGFLHVPDFLSVEDEAALLAHVRALPLEHAPYREYTARRRILSYGGQYDFGRGRLEARPPIPPWLFPLREKVGRWLGIAPALFVHGLVTEYAPGSPLGWHRDVPEFEIIVGVSLAGRARMRLRPYRPGERQSRRDAIALDLEPRCAYAMQGVARWGWQHCISETRELRYSITLRTARA